MKQLSEQDDMMNENEVWKPVVGYEGLYEVSNFGNVKSLDHYVTTNRKVKGKIQSFTWLSKGKVLKFGKRSDDYKDVSLTKYGVSCNVCVHRLVAEAFIPNPNNLPEVNHLDGNKANNNSTNLEWASYSENNIHAVYSGLNSQAIKVICNETGEIYPSYAEAERKLNLPLGTISTEIRNEKFNHGYTFIKFN